VCGPTEAGRGLRTLGIAILLQVTQRPLFQSLSARISVQRFTQMQRDVPGTPRRTFTTGRYGGFFGRGGWGEANRRAAG
jgi:hypothetical protein